MLTATEVGVTFAVSTTELCVAEMMLGTVGGGIASEARIIMTVMAAATRTAFTTSKFGL